MVGEILEAARRARQREGEVARRARQREGEAVIGERRVRLGLVA